MGEKTFWVCQIIWTNIAVGRFLTKQEFTKEEIDAAEKFIPTYVKDFVDCVDWHEGNRNLVKIHLLNPFVDCICLYGSSMNFNGAIGESHLKNKTKHQSGE